MSGLVLCSFGVRSEVNIGACNAQTLLKQEAPIGANVWTEHTQNQESEGKKEHCVECFTCQVITPLLLFCRSLLVSNRPHLFHFHSNSLNLSVSPSSLWKYTVDRMRGRVKSVSLEQRLLSE